MMAVNAIGPLFYEEYYRTYWIGRDDPDGAGSGDLTDDVTGDWNNPYVGSWENFASQPNKMRLTY